MLTLQNKFENYLAILLLLALCAVILFLNSPVAGDFSWSDAPRHALNGVFLKDFIAAFPLSNPKQYAIDYYLQYPALTILFYPPLMYLFMAAFYSIFGFSHAVAQASIAVFHFILGMAVYLLAQRWLPRWQALAAGVLMMGLPEVALWGRQVMLDIPAYAWLAVSALFLLRYVDTGKPVPLYLALLFLLCALYTKQVVIFMLAVFGLTILVGRGIEVLRQRQTWVAVGLFVIGLLPLIYLTREFGQVNLDSTLGSRPDDLEIYTWGSWLYYLGQMPHQLGWITTLLAAGFMVGMAVRPDWRLPKIDTLFLISWLLMGYLFFTHIALKSPRLNLTTLLPVVIFALLFLNRSFTSFGQQHATLAALILAVGTFIYSLIFVPVHYARGYVEAADVVVQQAPPNSTVLFSGLRDGSFIFNVRADTRRNDIRILRADKIMVRVSIERERGFQDRNLTVEAIHDLLKRYGVHYVVAQNDFWTDIPSMAALQELLHDQSRFQIVQRIQVNANFRNEDRELVIYRNLGPVAAVPEPISLEMLGIGRTFSAMPLPAK